MKTFYLIVGLLVGLYQKRHPAITTQANYQRVTSCRAGQDFKRNCTKIPLLQRLLL